MQHRPYARLAGTVVVGALALAACGGDDEAEDSSASELPEPTVVHTEDSAPRSPSDSVSGAATPPDTDGPVWEAPFDDVPLSADAMLVGLVFPGDEESDLSIAGTGPDGTTPWKVQTNPSCVGFGVTRAQEQPAAVVLASDADNRDGKVATETTANAYDVADGEQVWGPTPVPGPMQGPGLIFGENAPSVVDDEDAEEPKLMLAAETGEPVDPPREGADPLYEHEGVGLFEHDDDLIAVDTDSGSTLWESDGMERPQEWSPEEPDVELLPTEASEDGVIALRWSGSGSEEQAEQRTSLHEINTGRMIADLGDEPEPRTVLDTDSGTVVVGGLEDYRETRAFDRESGELRWEDDGSDGMLDMTLAAHGRGYGTRSEDSVAIDLETGRTLEQGDWEVPVAASASDVLVAPSAPDEADGTTERVEGAGPGYVAYEQG